MVHCHLLSRLSENRRTLSAFLFFFRHGTIAFSQVHATPQSARAAGGKKAPATAAGPAQMPPLIEGITGLSGGSRASALASAAADAAMEAMVSEEKLKADKADKRKNKKK
jgi:hypothetical protein